MDISKLKLIDFEISDIDGKKYLIAYLYRSKKTVVVASCLYNEEVYQFLNDNIDEDISDYITFKIDSSGKIKLKIDYKQI